MRTSLSGTSDGTSGIARSPPDTGILRAISIRVRRNAFRLVGPLHPPHHYLNCRSRVEIESGACRPLLEGMEPVGEA